MKQKFVFVFVSLIFIFFITSCSTPLSTTTTPVVTRTLSSTGVGEVYLVPDVAFVYIGVRVDADDVSTALSNNNIQAQAVAQAVKDLGVEAKDIQTTNFNVYPTQDYDTTGAISRKYYVVENTVYITVRDLTKLGQILDAVVRSGANTINGVTFDVQNKEAANAQARDLAIKNAIAEAESIAASAGVSIGDLQSISVYFNGSSDSMYGKGGGGMMASTSSVPVSAGQLVITANASLSYEIK
ncbi:MAG: SIMPL domain-containing protein [Chloroflexi bacterium]|nr:SIMPL domain-containing protein [Chloroflexota bacterium]